MKRLPLAFTALFASLLPAGRTLDIRKFRTKGDGIAEDTAAI